MLLLNGNRILKHLLSLFLQILKSFLVFQAHSMGSQQKSYGIQKIRKLSNKCKIEKLVRLWPKLDRPCQTIDDVESFFPSWSSKENGEQSQNSIELSPLYAVVTDISEHTGIWHSISFCRCPWSPFFLLVWSHRHWVSFNEFIDWTDIKLVTSFEFVS